LDGTQELVYFLHCLALLFPLVCIALAKAFRCKNQGNEAKKAMQSEAKME